MRSSEQYFPVSLMTGVCKYDIRQHKNTKTLITIRSRVKINQSSSTLDLLLQIYTRAEIRTFQRGEPTIQHRWVCCGIPNATMTDTNETLLQVNGGGSSGRRSPSPMRIVRRSSYKTSDLSQASKPGDITIQRISEAKGYLNDFEQLYRKHRAEIDGLKREHASEVGQARWRPFCVFFSRFLE